MSKQALKICLATSELAPLAKTGGLADVSAALSEYLHDAGHDVRVLLPSYARIESSKLKIERVPELEGLSLRIGDRNYGYSIGRARLPNTSLDIYLLRCNDLYARDNIYTQDADEHRRFILLSRAAIEMCQHMQFAPDIFSCHDWQGALIPLYLKSVYSWDRLFAATKSVLTIHNIGYQGMTSADGLRDIGLGDSNHLLHQDDLKSGVINFLKTGLLYADLITTVSPTYAKEILGPEYGMGLDHVLRERQGSVIGILNGVDYGAWDPVSDPLIPANYSAADMSGKAVCKRELIAATGLQTDPSLPIIGIVSRLVGQKGFDLVEKVLPRLLTTRRFALAVLGSGEPRYERFFSELSGRFRGYASYYRGYNDKLAHWIEAGSDMFLMPSRYEPCGLNQMYSLRYGTVPIVRETGGLADSVEQIDPDEGTGTGILFRDYNETGLDWAIGTALALYQNQPLWQRVVANGMAKDFSWSRQIEDYISLFRQLKGSA